MKLLNIPAKRITDLFDVISKNT